MRRARLSARWGAGGSLGSGGLQEVEAQTPGLPPSGPVAV